MHKRINYMKFSENLWTHAPDLQIQVKQTEEKNTLSFLLIFKQLTESAITLFFTWEFAWAY